MGFFKKLIGKSKGDKARAEETGTVIRKPEGATPVTKEKERAELTVLEMVDKQDWEVKTLPVWQPGDVILDTYEVEDVISGGMGHVYIANHNKWKVKLAIKSPNEMMLSDRSNFARILREANSWTELGLHPNIAYCYYVRNIEDVPHIFVEYVDGGNLRQWIEEGKCIDYRTSLDLAIQFCHGMEHAHSKGMIHRDIKPENVLMTEDGILKITDFGLVRGGGAGSGSTDFESGGTQQPQGAGLTTVGTLMGTEGYMAPEQAVSARDADERADIFAFGVCLYEMFCGNKPYEVAFGPRQEAPDPVSLSGDNNFPSVIASFLTKAVQWDRSERFKSFDELRQTLCHIYRDLFGEECPFAEMELVDLEADSLNNRGVSYFELGRREDALSCWEQAISLNQTHLEAVYNQGLILWRDGKIADDELLRRLENCAGNPSADKRRLAGFKAFIHADRSDFEAAREVLKGYPGQFDALFSGKDFLMKASIPTLQGHKERVSSVAVSPDGRHIVSGSWDNTLRVWELETGMCLNTLEGHKSWVNSVAVSPDGRHIVSGSIDETLRVWDFETGRCLTTLEGHTGSVDSVALSPDGRHIVSGGRDKTVRVWDIETGRFLNTFKGPTGALRQVAVSPDGRHIIDVNQNDTLHVYDFETGRCLTTLKGHTKGVSSVAVSPDGRHIVSFSSDKTLRVWELETRRCLKTMQIEAAMGSSIAVSPDGRYIVSGSWDKTIRVWDFETGRCLNTFQGHTEEVMSVAVSPDCRHIVSGGRDKTVRVWRIYFDNSFAADFQVSLPKGFAEQKRDRIELSDAVGNAGDFYEKGDYKRSFSVLFEIWRANKFSDIELISSLYSRLLEKGRVSGLHFAFQRKILQGHTDEVNSVAMSPDGRHIVSGGGWQDKTLRVWDFETGRCLNTLEGHTALVTSVAVSPDGRHIVSGGDLRMWDFEMGRCLTTSQGVGGVWAVAVSPDGRHIVSGGFDRTLQAWELETGRCLNTLQGHTKEVTSVAMSPDGRHIVSGSNDKTLRLWDFETGRCLNTLEGHTALVTSVAVSSDGRHIVSGSNDKTLRVWDFETGRCLNTLEGHTGTVSSVAMSPDGRHIVSGGRDLIPVSQDHTLRMWELETGKCLNTIKGHMGSVNSVVMSPDGRHIVSGGDDKTLRVWELIWDLEFPNPVD